MRKLIVRSTKEVFLSDLEGIGRDLVAYRSHNSENYCILAQVLANSWGFVPLNNSNTPPRFIGSSWRESVKAAGQQRELYVFESMDQMLRAMVDKKF